MDQYIKNHLTVILGDDMDDAIIEYIVRMCNKEDYEEFMSNIIDRSNDVHMMVYEAIKDALFGEAHRDEQKRQSRNKTSNANQSTKPVGNDQQKSKQNTSRNLQDNASQHKMPAKNSVESKQNASRNFQGNASENKTPVKSSVESHEQKGAGSSGKGKKNKYINFDVSRCTPGLKKGRHPCECEAKKHELINNCIKCGRIVCEQEGSGPCFFCGNMVCTTDEMELLATNSKQSDKLYNLLKDQKTSKEWKRAIEQRDRMISIDRQGSGKNKIVDDDNDYFQANSQWLDKEEVECGKQRRITMYERLHKSKKDLKLLLDFASRSVTVADDEFEKHKGNLKISVDKVLARNEEQFPKTLLSPKDAQNYEKFVESVEEQQHQNQESQKRRLAKERTKAVAAIKVSTALISNDKLLESMDYGMCLSMHQPWASLLIAGIKIHEGRTWPTDHRGRLWIHAGSKEPTDDEVLAVENQYRLLYNEPELIFPRKYPTSCLLGYVFLEDCLPQKKYSEIYGDGESDSPFVFICSSPVILPIFYPMQGQHKIFHVPKDLHKRAKEALMSLSAKWL